MSVPQINNGVIDNRGFEAALSWDDNIGDLNYHIGGQFSFARNKIVNQNEQYRPYDYLKRTGREMGINWGYEVIGIYKSQEDIDNRNVKQLLSEVTPGDLMFKDQNGLRPDTSRLQLAVSGDILLVRPRCRVEGYRFLRTVPGSRQLQQGAQHSQHLSSYRR